MTNRTATAAVAALMVAAPALAQKSKDTLRIGFYDPIPGVDLVYDPKGETALTARAVFDTLITYNEHGKVFEPLLAKSWRRVDPTTYEFSLRDDVKFHDGSPFDADDVVYTLNWVADPKVKFRIKTRFLWIKKAEKIDRYTVRVTTKGPRAVALARFAVSIPIFPSDVHGRLENKATFGKKPIGTGPYKVVGYDPNTGVRMVRNDAYRHGAPSKPRAAIRNVHVMPIPDVQTQVAQLVTGGLDMIHNVPRDQADNLAQDPRFAATVSNGILFRYIAFDAVGRTGSDDLKDVNVRRALIHAIDRDSIRRNIFAGGEAVEKMDSICKPLQIGCVFDVSPPAHDPAKAKKLLAAAGKTDLRLQITTLPEARKVAEAIAGYLRAVGRPGLAQERDLRRLSQAPARRKDPDAGPPVQLRRGPRFRRSGDLLFREQGAQLLRRQEDRGLDEDRRRHLRDRRAREDLPQDLQPHQRAGLYRPDRRPAVGVRPRQGAGDRRGDHQPVRRPAGADPMEIAGRFYSAAALVTTESR